MIARLTELNENEIWMYLGYRGQELSPESDGQLKRCIKAVVDAAAPRLIWRRFAMREKIFSMLPLEGEDIHELLEGCTEAVLMAITLGAGVERLLMQKEVTDMADAVIMDACASAAIENAADNFEMDLRGEIEKEGLFLTDRFSPGYGDYPLSVQKRFCAVLDTERKIGLSVSPSMLLIPRKSVTAVMGISKIQKSLRKRGCEHCAIFHSCNFRKEGRSCNKSNTPLQATEHQI